MPQEVIELIKICVWPFTIVFVTSVLLICFFIFKAQISSLLERFIKFKLGDKEILFQENNSIDSKQERIEATTEDSSKSIKDNDKALKLLPNADLLEENKFENNCEKDLFIETMKCLEQKNFKQASLFFDNLLKNETNLEEKLSFTLFYWHSRYQYGDHTALQELSLLAKQADTASKANYWIGLSLETSGEIKKALEYYKLSEGCALNNKDKLAAIKATSNGHFILGERQVAFQLLMSKIKDFNNTEDLADIWECLADLYKKDQNFELSALAFDKAIENRPNDTNLRFSSAYAYSHEKENILSLFHYKILLKINSNSKMALNNLGVVYDNLNLPSKSIKSYEKAFEQGETLSAANLAFKYMDSGFLCKASKILEQANNQAKVHPNVSSAVARLSTIRDDENKLEEKYLESAQEQRQFLLKFSEAYFIEEECTDQFKGSWSISRDLNITIDISQNNKLNAVWKINNTEHEINGYISNRASKIIFTNKVFMSTTDYKAYAYLSEQYDRLYIMKLEPSGHSFSTLEKIQPILT
jgi:Tetratricopeptide repeat